MTTLAVTLPDCLQRLTDCLPADPGNDGPIGVQAGDLRALLAVLPRRGEAATFTVTSVRLAGRSRVTATALGQLDREMVWTYPLAEAPRVGDQIRVTARTAPGAEGAAADDSRAG